MNAALILEHFEGAALEKNPAQRPTAPQMMKQLQAIKDQLGAAPNRNGQGTHGCPEELAVSVIRTRTLMWV